MRRKITQTIFLTIQTEEKKVINMSKINKTSKIIQTHHHLNLRELMLETKFPKIINLNLIEIVFKGINKIIKIILMMIPIILIDQNLMIFFVLNHMIKL